MSRSGPLPNLSSLRLMGKPARGVKLPPRVPTEPRWASIFGSESDEQRQCARDARSQWRSVVPELDKHGILSRVDAALMTDYCICWARLMGCERTLSREGLTATTERGVTKHPCVTMANQLRQALRAYLVELALTPWSRARMNLPADPADDWDELLDGPRVFDV